MQAVAEVAGVHQTTVSLALRNRPSLPEDTRLRIQKIAAEMGYRPDPALEALNAYRHPSPSGEVSIRRFSMVYMTNGETADAWKERAGLTRYRAGAMQRAEELGYYLTDFWLDQKTMTPRRTTQILNTRNVHGIIVPPLPLPISIDLEWKYFSGVSITSSLSSPHLHTVRNNHLETMQLVHRNLQNLGYRRIALALSKDSDERLQCRWSSGFWGEEGFIPKERRVPIFRPAQWNMEGFAKWFYKYKPEAIISITPHLTEIFDWLKKERIEVPKDLGIASLDSLIEKDVSGVAQLPEQIGATAVEILGGLIQRNHKGIPEHPQITLLCGKWQDGKTTRQQNT